MRRSRLYWHERSARRKGREALLNAVPWTIWGGLRGAPPEGGFGRGEASRIDVSIAGEKRARAGAAALAIVQRSTLTGAGATGVSAFLELEAENSFRALGAEGPFRALPLIVIPGFLRGHVRLALGVGLVVASVRAVAQDVLHRDDGGSVAITATFRSRQYCHNGNLNFRLA